ncbi:MAG TPA: hypothetical protein VFU22_10495 [Roseiflexaceae bacterium]|nr:hypothetical protein [Roseiflexaceae bacterium]
MTEQSQMPLVGPLKRRGWREIVWFRPLTSSTHAALVVTRRGRLTSILPAGGPRTLSDYLAWPYDFREVDTRERLLILEQRLESFDSAYEFLVALRLVYQVVRAERVALELDDVQAELAHAVVQSLRLSGRSFGIEQDKTFEQHLQETLLHNDALIQRIQALGLLLRRADVTVTLDEDTRAHAEALRFSMRERALHFQVAIECLEPDRTFDVHVGGAYRLTERRAQDGPTDSIESAIQMAITRTLRRVGITFAPSDYPNAAKAMAETLRRDALLQSELSVVQAQLLRPTVQIQPDHSMVHVPRPTPLGVPDTRSDPMLRRLRQGLPRVNRRPALLEAGESAPSQPTAPAPARPPALPPPAQLRADAASSKTMPLSELPVADAGSPTLPLSELPATNDAIEGAYALWPLPESQPAMHALPTLGQPDDDQEERAPWADLIASAEAATPGMSWTGAAPPSALSEPIEPLAWDAMAGVGEELAIEASAPEAPAFVSEPVAQIPWDSAAPSEEPAIVASTLESAAFLSDSAGGLAWDSMPVAGEDAAPEAPAFPSVPIEPQSWNNMAAADLASEQPTQWPDTPAFLNETLEPPPWDSVAAVGDEPTLAAPAWEVPNFRESLDPLSWANQGAAPPAPEDMTQLPNTPSFPNEPVEPMPWESAAIEQIDQQPAEMPRAEAGAAPLAGAGLDAVVGADTPILAPDALSNSLSEDLGFTLDWSEPQPEPSVTDSLPSHDTPASDDIVTVYWDDSHPTQVGTDSHSTFFANDNSAVAEAADAQAAPAFEADQLNEASEDASVGRLPAQAEHDQQQASLGLEASPWFTPVMHLDEQQTFDPGADAPAPIDSFAATWAEPPLVQSDPIDDAAVGDTQLPGEPIDPVRDAALVAPELPSDSPTIDDPVDQPLPEVADPIAAEALIEPLAPVDQQEAVDAEPTVADELITRMIGMIQSYGPAWFKMWSLELKERPERLPVVLGEVTADTALLEQANDPRVQSALVLALAAYSAPTFATGRLAASSSLSSTALAVSSDEDEDAVPDWLSLRVKWNGQGGGQ